MPFIQPGEGKSAICSLMCGMCGLPAATEKRFKRAKIDAASYRHVWEGLKLWIAFQYDNGRVRPGSFDWAALALENNFDRVDLQVAAPGMRAAAFWSNHSSARCWH
eukprot:SAG31_NODE_5957_length_2242_cov_1.153056_1_plen_106_part_00